MRPSGISGLTRSRGILGEGALYRHSLSLSLLPSPPFDSSISFHLAILAVLFPFLSLARRQAVIVREALKEGREKGRLFPKASRDHNKERCDFRSEERSDRGETFLSSLRAVVKCFSLSLSLSLSLERRYIYRKAMPYS